MEIDLNEHFVEAEINNSMGIKKLVKLPVTEESLVRTLSNALSLEKEKLSYKELNKTELSVLGLKKINNIKFEKPTNVYYLNLYLNLLKDNKYFLTNEEAKINNDILKGHITDLLNKEDFDYSQLRKEYYYKQTNEETKQEEKPLKEKPIFTIKDLQERHREKRRLSREGKQG